MNFPFINEDHYIIKNLKETVNTHYYNNKKNLNILPHDILNKVINILNYEDSININYLNRDFNSRYPKSYLQSKSVIIQPHGTIRTYYDEDKIKLKEIIEYRNGVKHGQYLKFYKYEKGDTKINLFLEANHDKNVVNGRYTMYFKNGIVSKILNWKNGKLYGNKIVFFENGSRKGIVMYKNGLTEGSHKLFFESGNIRVEGMSINNMKEGKRIYLSENGNILRIDHYINNELVKREDRI